MSGTTDIPIAEFATRANVTRRTVERKIRTGEIASGHVRRDGRRVFLHPDALALFTTNATRQPMRQRAHVANRVANGSPAGKPKKPSDTTRHTTRQNVRVANAEAARIAELKEALQRERERADKAEARAEAAEQERREVQSLLTNATQAVVFLQKQLAAPPDVGHTVDAPAKPTRSTDNDKPKRRWWWRLFHR